MTVKKRSLKVNGHSTSISLEDEFWLELKIIAENKKISLAALISEIDTKRNPSIGGLSSAIRVYVLNALKSNSTN